jgi:hypothetical protein
LARSVVDWAARFSWLRYLLHDRDTKYTQSFRAIIASGEVEPLALPARSPNLNAYSERWGEAELIITDSYAAARIVKDAQM